VLLARALILISLIFAPHAAQAVDVWSCLRGIFQPTSSVERIQLSQIDSPEAREVAHQVVQERAQKSLPALRIYPFGSVALREEDAIVRATAEKWAREIEKQKTHLPLVETAPQKIKAVTRGGGSDVLRVESGEKVFYLRPMAVDDFRSIETVRRTHAAGILNAELGLNTMPKNHFVNFNGKTALLSEEAIGTGHSMSTKSLSEVQSFEFLIGNEDVSLENFLVDATGLGKVIDHGKAWYPGAVPKNYFIAGGKLPAQYSRELIENLKRLGPTRMTELLSGHLTSVEIEAALFRREMLLKDAAKKGFAF
jgi:hypothetical protein